MAWMDKGLINTQFEILGSECKLPKKILEDVVDRTGAPSLGGFRK
jgi:hypothetical protein